MTKNQLATACLAALSAFAMTGCGDPKCDPACGTGYTCNTKVDPPACESTSPCNPACAAGQICDTTKTTPICVTPTNDCTPKCTAGQRCDKSVTPAQCVVNACEPACSATQTCDTEVVPAKCVNKVPCDPGCPSGTKCNANNVCECDPGCLVGQECDLTQFPATCKNTCNPPLGCGALETCNIATKQCEPAKCGTTQCQQGEGCFNPATGGTDTGTTCTCLPDKKPSAGSVDTCVEYGKVCDYDSAHPAASHCKLPGQFDSCSTASATPCETGLECVDYYGSGAPACMKPCTTNTDCGSWTGLYCGEGYCDQNICSIPELWAGQQGTTEAYWRSLFFKKCPVNAAGETDQPDSWKGTCVPYPYNYNGQMISLGICEEAGNVAAGNECNQSAGRENMNAVCGFATTCIGIQPADATHTGGGVCMGDCNAAENADPVNTCTGFCMDYSGVEDEEFNKTRWGFCVDGCEPLATTACTADALGNDRGCTLFGYCWALTDPAAGLNQTCADPTTAGDYRNNCGDRSICLGDGAPVPANKCFGFCDTAACPSTATCAACGAGLNLYCADSKLGDNLGVCYTKATVN